MTLVADHDSRGQLLARIVAEQDRAAFAELFADLAPKLKSYMQRMGAPYEQAEELVQETMLTVWRKAHQFDPKRATVAAWVFAIARNVRIDSLRRGAPVFVDVEAPDIESEQADAANALLSAESSARLRQALLNLPAEQQEVIRLAFFLDLSHGDIQQTLGLPLGTVKSRLRLAMAKLRALLADQP